jgi:two-component system cell cycle response regulator
MPRAADKPSRPQPRPASSASRRWVLAGLAGMTFCVAVAFSDVFRGVPPALAAILTIACGWLMLMLMSPWRLMRGLAADRGAEIRLLNTRLRMIIEGNRNIPMKDLVIDGEDDLADLSRTVHAITTESFSQRQQSRLLQRRMGEDIERQTKRATAHLERQATTDPMTGLGNRRALEQHLLELLGPHAPKDRIVTAMVIDLDRLKQINDTLGHEVGDRCLTFLADLLKNGLRREDCAIRLGGDEFVVLMPHQSIDTAKAVAARVSALLAQMPWPHGSTVARPTISVGLASRRAGESGDPLDLLRRADAALYASKHAGRRTIRAYGDIGRAA